MVYGFAVPFSSICAWPSAEFLCAVIALRSESACRVESLGRPHVAPARLADQYGRVVTTRGPGTLHVLSIPYQLLGDKGISSAELKKLANFHRGPK